MRRISAIGLATTSVAALSCLPSVAAAQSSTNSENAAGNIIIVTAQKREQDIQSIPIAISAFDEESIETRGIDSIGDLANQLPGVQFSEFSGSGNVSIRGVGTAIVSGNGENSVAVHVDGIFLSQPKAFAMVQEDIGRIEVLRGPQGTLYGRNSTGGVINLISQAPPDEFSIGASLLYGSYDQIRASANVGGPLGDNVSIRVSGHYDDRDGYTLNLVTGQDLEALEGYGGRVALDADLTEFWTSELRLTYRDENFSGPVYDSFDPNFPVVPPPLSALDPREVLSNALYDSSRELFLASWRNSFELSADLDLVLLTGYSDFNERGSFDGVGSLVTVQIERAQNSELFTQEINLIGETDGFQWLVGAYFLTEDISSGASTDLSAFSALPPGSILQINDQASEKQSYSAFADATISLTDRFRVYGGIRVIREELDQDLTVSTAGFVGCSPLTSPQSLRDTAVTGRAGVQYDIAAQSMIYGGYSRGYKPGGFSQSACNNGFAPETIDAFEVGLRNRFLNDSITLNLSAFYYDYSNIQLEQASPLGIFVVNAPAATIWGGEIEFMAELSEAFQIDAAVSLLDSQYDRFTNTDPLLGALPGISLAGVSLNYAPSFSGNFGAQYRIEAAGVGNLVLRGELYITSQYNLREFDFPYTVQSSFEQVNLYATFTSEDEHYRVRGFVKNLTDEDVLGGVLGFGGALGSFQPPRTYGVELSVQF